MEQQGMIRIQPLRAFANVIGKTASEGVLIQNLIQFLAEKDLLPAFTEWLEARYSRGDEEKQVLLPARRDQDDNTITTGGYYRGQ